MNAEASNALLKVLEEPPDRTLLILVALRTSDLLPTIVSRCMHIRFHPVPPKVLAEALRRENGTGENEAFVLASLANGSFAKALALKKTDWVARRNWLVGEMTSLDETPAGVILALAGKLAKNKDDAVEALEIVKTWLRDLIVLKYRPDKILNADLSVKLERVRAKRTEKELLDRISAVERAQKAVDSNANLRLILENLFLNLAEHGRNDR
jgi:DNA polymerase-3 subunit delta'